MDNENKYRVVNNRTSLNKEQFIAVHHYKGPMLVLAGPGSGKTKVLTERIRFLIEEKNVKPETILVITFSKKAAIEMRSRFVRMTGRKNYPVNFGTFHAIFYSILKKHKNYSKNSIITDKERKEYIADVGMELGIDKAHQLSWQKQMLELISNYKNFGENYFNDNADRLLEEDEKEEFKRVYEGYIKRCNVEEKIDFDDMILKCRELLYKHESILREWKAIYRFILVDEFQDINDLQYDVLRLIAGDDMNVFCVGDDDQSIYAFRGARPELMKKFVGQFPHCRQITLLTNYRCAGDIVAAADRLIRHNNERIERPKQLIGNDRCPGSVEVIDSESSILQAEQVCGKIMELMETEEYSYSDFAVLYRSGHAAKMFELVCTQKGISIDTRQECFNLFEIKEVCIIVSYLKASVNQAVRSDYFLIINNPPRGLSREALSDSVMTDNNNMLGKYLKYYSGHKDKLNIVNKLAYDLQFMSKLPPFAAIIYILNASGLYNYLKVNYKNNLSDYSLDEVIDMLEDSARGFDTIEAFLDFVKITDQDIKPLQEASKDRGTLKHDADIQTASLDEKMKKAKEHKSAVKLMTAHASKGLEFPVVFIIGLQEGLFPHNKGLHGKNLEEERRLMYVAMTRAQQRLYLCAIGMEHGKQKSRFIDESLQ